MDHLLLNLGKPATSIHREEFLKLRTRTSFPKELESEYLILPHNSSASAIKDLVNNPIIGWIKIYL
jgi:hypothetical protein